jgi:hypothetical protein
LPNVLAGRDVIAISTHVSVKVLNGDDPIMQVAEYCLHFFERSGDVRGGLSEQRGGDGRRISRPLGHNSDLV